MVVVVVVGVLASPGIASAAPPLSTCFCEGPISTSVKSSRGFDGRDFNFPEESATYWLARFHMPAGAHVVLGGTFAHARS